MKILKILYKNIVYLKSRYVLFKNQPLTKNQPLFTLLKYIYVNIILYVFKREITFIFLDKIKVKAINGDGIIGNYHSILQEASDSIFLLHFLNDTDTFLDVGANVGHYTLLASVIKNTHVIAIEPIHATFNRLKCNIEINAVQNLVNSFNIGLSDKEGELTFSANLHTTNRVINNGLGVKVRVKTIDDLCQDKVINAIKIDVEGFEWFVLNGAKEILKSTDLNVIVIELNNSGIEFGIQDNQIVTLLNSYGFLQYEYDFFEKKLLQLDSKNNKQFNTIFIKDIHFVQNRIRKCPKIKISKNLSF
jgi:FkbM family methyltransferase